MGKLHALDELPLANLDKNQLDELKKAEAQLNQEGDQVYLIAFKKEAGK
ncbi:hypothetical protein [Brevibacillus sp. SYSU BS000544]